jgi:hypothetical protein
VVATVSVTFAVVVVLLKLREVTADPFCANAHVAPVGSPEHASVLTVPANPFDPVKVRVVVPDCPGLVTVTVVGDAATAKVGKPPTKFATFSEPRPVAIS